MNRVRRLLRHPGRFHEASEARESLGWIYKAGVFKRVQMKLSGKTKFVGILGYPVSHSLSPAMHNAAFQAMKLDYYYLPFSIIPKDIGTGLRGLQAIGCKGLNVTIPHKQTIMKYLNGLSREARLIGAVNTVQFRGRKLIGHNTDGRGFTRAFRSDCKRSLKGQRVLLLGAGGAARAVAVQLLLEGVRSLVVANRTARRGRRLVNHLLRVFPGKQVAAIPLQKKRLEGPLKDVQIVINATSAGMKQKDKSPLSADLLHRNLVIYDLIYHFPTTPLLRAAHKAGAKGYNGMGMLLYQGALSFEIWTGKRPNIQAMKQALLHEI